jgi:hypothetical protein
MVADLIGTTVPFRVVRDGTPIEIELVPAELG